MSVYMKVVPDDYNEIIITSIKVKIYNLGTIVIEINPKNFTEGRISSTSSNPLIAFILYKHKTIEKFVTGFKRVFELCDKKIR